MTFYESQRWHSGEKRGFRLNVRRVAAAAAFASAEHFQSENALERFAFEIIQSQKQIALMLSPERLAHFMSKALWGQPSQNENYSYLGIKKALQRKEFFTH